MFFLEFLCSNVFFFSVMWWIWQARHLCFWMLTLLVTKGMYYLFKTFVTNYFHCWLLLVTQSFFFFPIRFRPDAIVFDSYQAYGTPSYWMQQFFSMSNGATLLDSTHQTDSSTSLMASAIWFQNPVDTKNYLRVKVKQTLS